MAGQRRERRQNQKKQIPIEYYSIRIRITFREIEPAVSASTSPNFRINK